jgi:excisionase family DNA binding protein
MDGKPMSQNILAEFVDKRVDIVGVFDKHSKVYKQSEPIHTTLMQDVHVIVEGVEHDLGHAWIQFSDELAKAGVALGDRVKCNCRVRQYKKYVEFGTSGSPYEIRQNLSYPTNIEILNRVKPPPEIEMELEDEPDDEPDEVGDAVDDGLISVGKAAKILGCDAETVRQMQADGKLAVTYTKGHHRRYDRKEVERLAKPQTTPSITPPVVAPAPTTPAPAETVGAVSLIVEVRRLAKMAGGMDALGQLVEALR